MSIKKILTVILAVSMILTAATGCSRQTENQSEPGSETVQSTDSESGEGTKAEEGTKDAEASTRTIIDHTGAEVEIPAEINRVVISSLLPLPSVYCLYRGSADNLVGMHPSSMEAAVDSYLINVFPEIADIDTSFVENGEVNIEQLMTLEPDVVFYLASNTEEREMYDNAGITAVGFSTTASEYNTIETYANWIQLLSDIYGESEKANEIIEFGRNVEAEITAKTAGLEEGEKPRVLILFNYENGTIKTSGSDFFGQYWIEAAGGINVASELSGTADINMEQIYEWNPDMIFISNFVAYQPEDLLNNTIEGHDWSTVKAVQDGKVYKFPLGMYRWFPPSSDTPLSLMWIAKKIQPDLFADIDLDSEVREYYEKYYNVTLTDDDLQDIYTSARKTAGQ